MPSSPCPSEGKSRRRWALLLAVVMASAGAGGRTAPVLKSLGGTWGTGTSQADEQIRQAALKDPFPDAGPQGF